MKVGMIAILALAALGNTDDTSRVIRSISTIPNVVATHRMHECARAAPRRAVRDSILQALRDGGLVLVFRHSLTDHSQADARELSRADRSTQRNLTAAGVMQAKRIGELIRALGVPVGDVHASPLFRTMDTAVNAFGVAEPSEALWRNGTAAERTRLLSEPPRAGTNRVLVTHNFVLVAIFRDFRPGDLREGDAVVVRPRGDGQYDVLRRLTVDDLARLAEGG